MALIGKIRNNSWLLVVLIGLALAAFVIMDMTSGGNGAVANQFELGEVNGEQIDWNEFQNMERTLYANSSGNIYARRDFLWNYFVNRAIIREEAEELGLAVGSDELMELQFGVRLSPVIRQRFSNPQTNQVDRQQLNQLRSAIQQNQLPIEQKRFWQVQEQEVINNRLQNKLATLVGKGMYTPTWLAEAQSELQSKQATFAYVKVPFSEISDSEVSPSDEDLQRFLDENKVLFTNDQETRVAEYTVLNVYPTPTDSAELFEKVKTAAAEFATAENDSLFVEFNDGVISGLYSTVDEVDPVIADTLPSIPTGAVYGPYESQGAYRAVKVIDKTIIPDSVQARHIFRQVDPQNPNSFAAQKALLDSLKNLVASGQASFDSLAMTNGMDGTASNGGDLGYFTKNAMLPTFEMQTFYEMEVGELKVFASQAGLHLVEVLDKKYINNEEGYKLAFISENIVPSETTQNRLYENALTLASDNRSLESLTDAVNGIANLQLYTTAPLQENDFQVQEITSPDASRSLVRYVFQEDVNVGDVSPDVFVVEEPQLFYNKQYIIAGLKSIIPSGTPKLEDVRTVIYPEVLKEKKAMLLKERLTGQSLQAAAGQFDAVVDTARNISLNSTFAQGLGSEPSVIAALQDVAVGQSAGPIVGDNGVYMIQMVDKVDLPMMNNIAQIRQQANFRNTQQIQTKLMTALKANAKIQDERSRFY